MKLKNLKPVATNDDNLLPLVNIIFLLLIFFMLAGVIAKQKDLYDVDLASATIEDYVDQNKNVLFISKDGLLILNDIKIDKKDLKNKLQQLKDKNILIAADGSLSSTQLNNILLILSDSDIKNVTLLSHKNE
tara:strand:+ start:177 stop:572 length:396 start_codon:yes stop_codon:yes gene_type:complete